MDIIIEANISAALDTSGTQHVEMPDYPIAALRELIRNAVIHRDYENSNSPVRVYWFTDRIEITSPGGVYGKVSNDNFGQGITDYRNPTIAEALKNMGFMQHFGIGIATAQKALERNGNPQADFSFPENFIFATVKRRP